MSNFKLKQNGAQVQKAIDYAMQVPQLSEAIAEQETAVSNLTERVEMLESGEDGEPENLIVSYTDGKYMSSGYLVLTSGSLTLAEAHGLVPGRKLRCTLWADPNNTINTAFGFSADDVGVKDYTEFTWTALGNDIYECTIPTGVEILKFNIYTTQKEAAVCYMPNAETEGDNTDEIKYIPSYITNIIAKPLGFESGKKLVAFGDSITFGVQSYFDSSGNKQLTNDYTNHYIKIFCDTLGLVLTNKALSGTTLANVAHPTEATLTADKSIYAQVTTTDLSSYDYILIAGGCNDGALQTTLGTLGSTDDTTVYGALEKMCQYIRENKKTAAKVILITPIPLLKTLSTPLETYRNAVFEVAVRYGYNVVDGYKLGFPYEESNYSKMVFPDGCHPSIVGHRMYANSLLGVLVCEQIETAEIPTPEPPATTITNYAEPNDTNTTDWGIWINDSRIGSDGTRRDAPGYSVSNYIRMKKGDYVEFEGFSVEEQFPVYCLYDSGKNKVGTVAWAQYYKDNGIATFVNFSGTRQRVVFSNVEESVYYVRVCGKPSNTVNDVIITINEEIS